jgi:DNA topoisomerase I
LLLEVKDKVEAELRDDLAGLKPEEAAVLTLLQARLSLTLKDKLIESTARLN